jgi:hypothetical protein
LYVFLLGIPLVIEQPWTETLLAIDDMSTEILKLIVRLDQALECRMELGRNASHHVCDELLMSAIFGVSIALERPLVLVVVCKELVVPEPPLVASGSSVVIKVGSSMSPSKRFLPVVPSRHVVPLFFGQRCKPLGCLALEKSRQ